jgi:hypothetical protein
VLRLVPRAAGALRHDAAAVEAESSNVTVALAYGLPCATGPHCGFDDPEVEVLSDCRPGTIARFVRARAGEPAEVVAGRAHASLALARRRLRPGHYAAALRRALDAVLTGGAAVPAR